MLPHEKPILLYRPSYEAEHIPKIMCFVNFCKQTT